MYELLKDVDKKVLYETYSRIVDDPKDYKKVKTKTIIEELITYYMDYKNILSVCSFSEMLLLDKVVNKTLDASDIIKDRNFDDLITKFLLFYDTEKNEVFVPLELEKTIKEAYKKMDREELSNVETLDVLLIGLFKIYGMLSFKNLFNILQNYIVVEENKLKEHLDKDKYFKFHVDLITYKKKVYYIYRSYKEVIDTLYSGIDSFKDIDYHLRPFEEIIYLRYNHLYDMNKDIMKLQEELNKNNINEMSIILEIVMDTVLDSDRKDLTNNLSKYGDEFIRILNNAMDNMPSACLKGYTRKEYLETVADKKYDEEYDKVRYDNDIIKYKEIREKTKVVMDEAMYFAFKEKLTDKFNDVIKKNSVFFTEGDTAIVSNLVLFHTIDKDESIFDIFFSKKVTIFFPFYEVFKQFKDSYVEGLFNIINVNKNEGFVTLKNVFSKREYKVYDVALSSNKNVLDNYIYTSLVTVDNFTFTTDYMCILGKDNKVLEKIDKRKNKYIDIVNDSTKTYLACYEIFRDSSLNINFRNLE